MNKMVAPVGEKDLSMDGQQDIPTRDSSVKSVIEGYQKYSFKKIVFLLLMAVAIFVLMVLTIHMGATDLSYLDIIKSLVNRGDSWYDVVIWELRLPRLIAAVVCGSVLGVCGCVMQSILRNPMASPYTLGLSNAAAFGASLAISLTATAGVKSIVVLSDMDSPVIVTLFAFGFSMISVTMVLLITRFTGTAPEMLVLAGIAISSIFSAFTSLIQYFSDEDTLQSMVYWTFGNLDKINWHGLQIMILVCIPIVLYFYHMRWDYNAMESGENVAVSLGMNIARIRVIALILNAVAISIVVSFLGVIGFVGLLGPHMVKRLIGNDNRYVIPGSMLMGASVLLVAYMIGTYAFSFVIPVGIITSAFGGPAFLAILIRRYRNRC